jgi:transposase-like protein
MQPLSYARHQFPPEVIRHAVWLCLRFTLSYRDVEELLAERGIQTTYETIRRWVLTFGPVIARRLRSSRPKPHGRWHLDAAGRCTCGEPSMLKARCWTCWSSPNGTGEQPRN